MSTAREVAATARRRVLAVLVLLFTGVAAAVSNRWAGTAGDPVPVDPALSGDAHAHAHGGGLTSVVSLLAFTAGVVVLVMALLRRRPG